MTISTSQGGELSASPEALEPSATTVIRRNSRSFSLAVRFLPSDLHQSITSLYAWCRTVDDTVDRADDTSQAMEQLDLLESDLTRMQNGLAPVHPASRWIQPLVSEQRIQARHASELIEGMRMDLRKDPIHSNQQLDRYCYHVAGTVGLMITSLMGVRDVRAKRHAISLGIAMQLTNIARDVREDALLGRSYLPQITNPMTADPRDVQSAVRDLLKTAEIHYDAAISGLHYLPRRCQTAVYLALCLYRAIGREILHKDCHVLDGRTFLRTPQIVKIASHALTRSVFIDPVSSTVSSFRTYLMNQPTNPTPSNAGQAKHTAYLGLSLTSTMAVAVFFLVFLNPKQTAYSNLPLIYAICAVFFAVLFNRLAARCEQITPAHSEKSASS